MPSFRDELRAATDLDHLLSVTLFDGTPFVFGGDREAYLRWKNGLAEDLDVDPYSLLMVGSAALGISIGPEKDFRPFSENSDIDLAVVSQHHFDIAWRFMRNIDSKRYALDDSAQRQIMRNAREYVFLGVIPTDRFLPRLPLFGPVWTDALNVAGEAAVLEGREVKMRLYRDMDALRGYHKKGLQDSQRRLLTKNKEG